MLCSHGNKSIIVYLILDQCICRNLIIINPWSQLYLLYSLLFTHNFGVFPVAQYSDYLLFMEELHRYFVYYFWSSVSLVYRYSRLQVNYLKTIVVLFSKIVAYVRLVNLVNEPWH